LRKKKATFGKLTRQGEKRGRTKTQRREDEEREKGLGAQRVAKLGERTKSKKMAHL